MRTRAFTLFELLVAIALVGGLIAAAGGWWNSAVPKARQAECLARLRPWGAALHAYASDSGGFLPRRGQGVQPLAIVDRPEDWFNALASYMAMDPFSVVSSSPPSTGLGRMFQCPAETSPSARLSYGMNMYLSRWDQAEPARLAAIPQASTLVFLADSPGGYASTLPSARAYSVPARHGGRANVLFLDGHAASFDAAYLGIGQRPIDRPDVRWRTGLPGDTWDPER